MPTVIKRSEGKVTIKCPFCHGVGKDPFELLSALATCQVCQGKGQVTLPEPVVECAFCGGTGIHRDQRLTCSVCDGKGMVTVQKPTETCPQCHGRGVPEFDYLPCSLCGGVGVITVQKKAG